MNNPKKKKHASLIKVISISVVSLSCFALGAFVGQHFGDKKQTHNLEQDQDNESGTLDNARSVASVDSYGKVLIVGKKQKTTSFEGTNRAIASVDEDALDDRADGSGKYTIAITTYEKKDLAIIHVEELRSQGFIESFYVKTGSDPSEYQVNIGIYDTRKDAISKKNSLSQILDLSEATVKLQNNSLIKVNFEY